MSKFVRAGFLMPVLVFVSRDFELGKTWLAVGVDRQSRMGLIFS